MGVKKAFEFYRCSVCGNCITTVFAGGGTLVCCEKEMVRLDVGTVEGNPATHTPVVEKKDGGILVKVGENPHPMVAAHYICAIVVNSGGEWTWKMLTADSDPEAFFPAVAGDVEAYAFCNLHGLWKGA